MINLYDRYETEFLSNGLGTLSCWDSVVEEELNGIFRLTFKTADRLSDKVTTGATLRADVPGSQQPFRIWSVKNIDGVKTVTAYHISFDLYFTLIEDKNLVELGSQAALTRLLEDTPFTALSDVTKTASARIVRQSVQAALFDSDNSFLSYWGGEFIRDKWTLSAKNFRGRTFDQNPVSIRAGKNLIGYEKEEDESTYYNRIMPIGFNGLLLPELYIDRANIDLDNVRAKKVEYFGVRAVQDPERPSDDELPLEDAFQALRDAVTADFSRGTFDPKVNYKVSFVDLSKTEEYKNISVLETRYLGDEVKVVTPEFDVIARVISYRYDPIAKEYIEIELGNFTERPMSIIGRLELVETMVTELSDRQVTEQHITDLITSAVGGKVDTYNGTLYAMDTDDPMTAQVVAVLNRNGLGFSSTGVNGPFTYGITRDGTILGSYILTNSITANKLSSDVGQNLDLSSNESITLRVKSEVTEQTSPLITRISDTEQKVEPDAIISTVRSSTQYATDQSAKENTIYKSTTAPPSPTLNKLWLDLSVVPNVIRRWTGTEWIKTSPTTAQDIAYSPSNPASLEEVVTGAVSRLEQADTDITAMFEQIQEGARNLLDGSTRLWSNANFKHSEYPLAENVEVGEIVSIALKGYLGAGRTSFALYNTYADSYITSLTSLDYKDGIYTASFPWVGTENTSLVIYQQPEAGATISRIEWATLVRGDTPVRRQIKTQSELYTGIVRLFKDGITVGRSDTDVQTWLAYDGLRILTGLNSVPLAEFTLDGAETSRLYAGRAYAENMANCFRGTVDVYVGASPTGDGSGKDELNLSDGVMTALNYALDGARSLESSAVINVRIQGVKKNEAVLIRGISGDGTINLIGAYGSTQIAGNIQIRNCTCRINLNGITLVNVDTNQAFGLIHVSGLCNVSIDSCRLDGGNVKNGVTAISGAKVRITGTPTVNCLNAYYADDLSEIFAYDNFGQGNINVAHSRMGSRIFLYDSRPNGTNPVLTATGGTVDDKGVGTGSSFSYTPPAFTNSTKTFYPLKAGTYYSGESFVFATEWRQGRATNGKVVIGFAEFGSQIKDWLESAGGYQGTPTIQIYADRNLSSGGGSVSMKIGTPSVMTLPAVVRGGKASGTAPGALASSMVASSNLTLKSNTTSATDYGGFKIRVVVTAQKKV